MDTNVSNYTPSELLAILEMDDPTDTDDIIYKTNTLIRKFQVTNPTLSLFFRQVQTRLVKNNCQYDDTNNNDTNI